MPLKLQTHRKCNGKYNLIDEKIGQLIALKRSVVPPARNRRLEFKRILIPGWSASINAISNVDIKGAIRRWVSGFHAALYREPLPVDTQFGIETPFPSARFTDTGIQVDQLKPQHRMFVELLKKNRAARNIDQISTNKKKLKYECVWVQLDNAEGWICIFALDIYGWKDLGDVNNFVPRGCAGFYLLPSREAPSSAALSTKISLLIPNYSPFDPFGG